MKIGHALLVIGLVTGWLALSLAMPAYAGPPQQQFATNTPLPDGRIIYKVQPGDTCTRIQLLYAISFDELRQLNQNINAECTNIIEGQELLVGTAGGSGGSTGPGPSPTVGPPTLTPTPFTGTTEICVLLFDDLNGDALREADEPAIAGGAISVTEINGQYSDTRQTAINSDPEAYQGICFSNVPEGQYNIGAAIPDTYNPTMALTYSMDVRAGDRAFVDFGAQSRGAPGDQPGGPEDTSGASPLMGIIGGLLLLGGVGLGWYALRLRSPAGRLKTGGFLRR